MRCEKQITILFPFGSFKICQLLNLQTFCSRVYQNKIFKINLWWDAVCYYLSKDVSVFHSLQLLLSAPQFSCFLFQPTVFYSISVSQSQSLCLYLNVESVVLSPSGDENFWQLFIVVPFEFNTTHPTPYNTCFHIALLIRLPLLFYGLSAKSINKMKSLVEFWWWEFESLQRVEWVYEEHKYYTKPWQCSCISSLSI